MSELTEVPVVVRKAYEDAHRHLDGDLTDASTPAEARRVQDNHDDALANYQRSIRISLSGGDGSWTVVMTEASNAQAAVEKARDEQRRLIDRIELMTAATGAMTRLLAAAS